MKTLSTLAIAFIFGSIVSCGNAAPKAEQQSEEAVVEEQVVEVAVDTTAADTTTATMPADSLK